MSQSSTQRYNDLCNAFVSVGGRRDSSVSIGEYSTLSPGVVLVAGSDDYLGGIATPLAPMEVKGDVEIGYIRLEKHCLIGANSVVLPNVVFAEGASVGALSLVKCNLESWVLYAGIPARKIKSRNRERILNLENMLKRKR